MTLFWDDPRIQYMAGVYGVEFVETTKDLDWPEHKWKLYFKTILLQIVYMKFRNIEILKYRRKFISSLLLMSKEKDQRVILFIR